MALWYQAARTELDRVGALGAALSPSQRSRYAGLESQYQQLPPRVAWMMVDNDAVARAAATIAELARNLYVEVSMGHAPPPSTPVPVPTGPEPGSDWNLPELPDLPGLPGLPKLPSIGADELLILAVLAAFAGGLFVGSR